MDIKLLPKQWEVFHPIEDVDYDIRLYQGGVGSGKTFLGALKGLQVMHDNPGCTWLVAADTLVRLKITTCESYQELLNDAGIVYRYNKTDRIIYIPEWGNSRVIFKGVDDPLSLRSVNAIGAHIEEASLITETAYLEVLGRLRQAQGRNTIQVLLTTNPQAQKGWLHDHFVENAGIEEVEIRGGKAVFSRRRVIARTIDNPYISNAFIASLKASYDPELFKIMVYGEDGDYTRGLVSSSFSDLNIIETEYKPDLKIHLSCDFNVDPMSWTLSHRYNGEYHFFDEIVIENTNIDECVREFARRYPTHSSGVVINGDASGNNRDVRTEQVGGTSFTQMVNSFNRLAYPSQVKVDVRQKNPPPADRTAAWNAMVCNADGVRRVFIHPRCKWLIWNCHNLKYKEGTGQIDEPTVKDIEKDPKLKFTKHVWDAASYEVEKYDPVRLSIKNKKPGPKVPTALERHYARNAQRNRSVRRQTRKA